MSYLCNGLIRYSFNIMLFVLLDLCSEGHLAFEVDDISIKKKTEIGDHWLHLG